MTKILVTGGAGYVGSHCCKSLALAGFEPVVFDSLVHGRREAVRWGPLEVGDLSDRTALIDAIRRHKPKAVLHFAGFIAAGESVEQPILYYRQNIAGTLSLIEAMAETGLAIMVFSSTAATYGNPRHVPIEEAHVLDPINPYGRSKLMAERLLADQRAAQGLRFAALRYFNACGADPEGELGECHEPETHLVPLAAQAALGLIPALSIFGTDYPTDDGTAVRDYIHVTDLAAAHIKALELLLSGRPDSLTMNLGTGHGFSVRQIIRAVETETGKGVPCREQPRRPGDPAVLVADPGKARQVLDWKPCHSDLATIVRSAVRWEAGGRRFP